ncbi:MAG: hypothetical protein ACTSQE_13745 [Candidatus Heimdallarchaeaceae archaeon]
MRLSSLFAIIASAIGFLSVLTPACFYIGGPDPGDIIALSWIELHESPVLWIYLAATVIVAAHDIEWLDGIEFLRKSNIKLIRVLLLLVGVLMAFSLELSVNVYYSQGPTYWEQSLFFKVPEQPLIQKYASVGYHLIRVCRLILMVAIILAIFDQYTPKYYRNLALKVREQYKKEQELKELENKKQKMSKPSF